jgi:hypothetical protein
VAVNEDQCRGCGERFDDRDREDILGPDENELPMCVDCFGAWDKHPASERGVASGSSEGNYYRQLHDWIETRRLERLNGAK